MTIEIDTALVRQLIAEQFPQWSGLPLRRVEIDGWDNRTFHLGDDLTVRLPSAERYASQVDKEHEWLPILAPYLPLPIPESLSKGVPSAGYPWSWSIRRWIEGQTATIDRIGDLCEFAAGLGQFLLALQECDATNGPPPGHHNFFRGGSLTVYDGETRDAIASLHGRIDHQMAIAVWERSLESTWDRSPVWIHGDVSPTNLLVQNGRLCAVIDFGGCGVGDPACDLAIAWTLFRDKSRKVFRDALGADPATWERGRGWALWKGLITAAKHMDSNPPKSEPAMRVVDTVMGDWQCDA